MDFLTIASRVATEEWAFITGDRVTIDGADVPVWEVMKEVRMRGSERTFYKVVPIDPVTGNPAAIVLTKDAHPVDYVGWMKSKGYSSMEHHYDEFTAENDGSGAFTWNKPQTVSVETMMPVDA